MSFDVALPRDHRPIFPERCVACGGAPERTVPLRSLRLASPTLEAPVCARCSPRVRAARLFRHGTALGVALVTYLLLRVFVLPSLPSRGLLGLVRAYGDVGGAFLALFVAYVALMFAEPPIDVVDDGKTLHFEFRSEAYAHEFADANNGHVVES